MPYQWKRQEHQRCPSSSQGTISSVPFMPRVHKEVDMLFLAENRLTQFTGNGKIFRQIKMLAQFPVNAMKGFMGQILVDYI